MRSIEENNQRFHERFKPAILRYELPPQNTKTHQTHKDFLTLSAPVVNGFSNPNEIVYDQAYITTYLRWAENNSIVCGCAIISLVTSNEEKPIRLGIESGYLGHRFHADDLMSFLKSRTDGPVVTKTFRIGPSRRNSELQDRIDIAQIRRLKISPWVRDLSTVIEILSEARYRPAYPIILKLLDDPEYAIRYSVVVALSRFAKEVPEAREVLRQKLTDPELGRHVMDCLTFAGAHAVPIYIHAMNSADPIIRCRAVYYLKHIHPFESAIPGLVGAIDHQDSEVRLWGLSVLAEIQNSGVSITNEQVINLLSKRLFDGDEELRKLAVHISAQLHQTVPQIQSALLKVAETDRSDEVRKRARKALDN